jgi:hypothetical protein
MLVVNPLADVAHPGRGIGVVPEEEIADVLTERFRPAQGARGLLQVLQRYRHAFLPSDKAFPFVGIVWIAALGRCGRLTKSVTCTHVMLALCTRQHNINAGTQQC